MTPSVESYANVENSDKFSSCSIAAFKQKLLTPDKSYVLHLFQQNINVIFEF